MNLFKAKLKFNATSKRVLLMGPGPHPDAGRLPINGATVRVRHFAQPLEEAGYEVIYHLLEDQTAPEEISEDRIIQRMSVEDFQKSNPHLKILKKNDQLEVRAIIGVGSLMPVAVAAQFAQKFDIPFWCDFNGDPLSEWHASANDPFLNSADSNYELRDQIWLFVRRGLIAGDMFSGVTEAQCRAILGQLLLLGKLTNQDEEMQRICTITNAIPERWLAPPEASERLRAEMKIEDSVPLVALTGSATAWTDLEATAQSCAKILEKHPNAKIISRVLHPSDPNFRIKLSGISEEKIVYLNSEEFSEHDVLSACQATVLCDRDIAESALGSRNRLLVYLRYPLAIFVSTNADICRRLVDESLAFDVRDESGYEFELLDHEGLLKRQTIGLKFLESFTYRKTTHKLQEWLKNPTYWNQKSSEDNGRLITEWASMNVSGVELFPESF